MSQKDGLILLNKPGGITSFRVLDTIKKNLSPEKIGHSGTLDKFAQGLLLVMAGKATKLSSLLMDLRKSYSGIIHFGAETTTLDPEGEVCARAPLPSLSDLEKALPFFQGIINQIPPAFSALHIQGKRAYSMARKGEDFEIPEREIEIYSFNIIAWEPPFLSFQIECSRGTYVRSLARDLALACGSRGYLTELTRTALGPFSLKGASKPEEFDKERDILPLKDLFPMLKEIQILSIRNLFQNKLLNGFPISDDFFSSPPIRHGRIAVFDDSGIFLALVEKRDNKYSYLFVAKREGL